MILFGGREENSAFGNDYDDNDYDGNDYNGNGLFKDNNQVCFKDLHVFDTETSAWTKLEMFGDLPPSKKTEQEKAGVQGVFNVQ